MDLSYQHNVSPEAAKNIAAWLSEPKYAEYRAQLEQMIHDKRWHELEDSFFKVLDFGTAGRRGQTGIGSNRVNRVTIGESAQALCKYAMSVDDQAPTKGIVIACDTRLSSPELSRYAAQVCAANGFNTYIFDSFRATPELSFAVRYLACAAGIVISASHNPPADNGFKAYWNDGAQLVAPHDKGVLDIAAAITTIDAASDYDVAVESGQITIIGHEVDDAYHQAVVAQSMGSERDLHIVYSPLHGAGQTNVLPVLQKAGFSHITLVDEQMAPDGNFPTVESNKPNPETRAANDRAVALMLVDGADIAITNDPDADRLGVMVRVGDEAKYLSGNQTFALATDFALQKLRDNGTLSPQHYIVKNIVTTDLVTALAEHHGVKLYGNILVGFKYIGEIIRNQSDTGTFVIGGEESFGLLRGDYARDKDGAAVLGIAEYAAELKKNGKTLWSRLMELYNEHGLFTEMLQTVVCPGAGGFVEMQAIMQSMRENPPTEVDGHVITAVNDYRSLVRRVVASGGEAPIDCLSGDVISYEFNNDPRCRVTIRPSGTEPIMKFYVQWYSETTDATTSYEVAMQHMENIARKLEGTALERV